MRPLAFTDAQLSQIKTVAYPLPFSLRGPFLHRLAELLPADFGDADVWRCVHKAAREVMLAPRKTA
jgi:hypothetical protein